MTQEQINNVNLIISKFNELGILEHVEFIGSWATYLYQQYFRDDRFIPDLRTRDIDIPYPNIRKPRHAVDIKTGLSDIGFELYKDRHSGVTRFFKDGEFELEFLVQEKGKGTADAYKIEALNIYAEGLRNLDILIDNAIYIETINGLRVMVPRPAASVIHKLVINNDRFPLEKREKDLRSAEYLLQFINENSDERKALSVIYNALTKKQKNRINESANRLFATELLMDMLK